jgi:acyl-CoA synthetase (AMP-forming)/AMP-acid ligase II
MSLPQTLIDVVRSRARDQPDAEALVGGGVRRSWADLAAGAAGVANALRKRGVCPGDRVGILGTNCPAWVESLLGVHAAGAVAVPLNARLAPVEIARLLDDAGVAALVAEPQLLDGGVQFDGPTVPLGVDGQLESAAAPDAEASTGPLPDDLAVIAYTSGTTGVPKGAMWSHRALLASAQGNPFSAALAAGARVLLVAPLGAGGAVIMASNALAIGSTLVIAPFTPAGALQALADDGIEFTGLVPTMIALMVDAAPRGWHSPKLRRIYYGAGTMTPRLFARAQSLFGCEFQQGYGMTETCILGTRLDPADHTLAAPQRLASAGKPMPGVDIKIVGEDGAAVSAGAAGEICVRSPGNMLGYWRREEESRSALHDGWYRTRDIGHLDQDGYLYLLDRKDDMVKSGGFNVSPAEVEGVLSTHPGVEEVAVIGLPDERWGQRVAAVVRTRPGVAVDELDLLAFCRDQLAGYKRPRTVLFAKAPLPRNALGKVSRQTLRSRYRTQVAE